VSRARRELAPDESIPNLFDEHGRPVGAASGPQGAGPAVTGSAGGAAQSPAGAAGTSSGAQAVDTNFYSPLDLADAAQTPPTGSGGGGTTEWVRRVTTPAEVVNRAVSLPGVAGALVALPDGLSVAGQVPAQYNSETLAAFLPQIYTKVSQCTQELRMGALNNLSFTVGQVPWKIFRVNNLFFAAFGRAGEPLPTAQLAALAAELDRKPKTV